MTAEELLKLVEEYGQASDDQAAERLAQVDAAVTGLANERNELAAQFAAGKTFSTWYRSVTPDGKVWCETSNPREVVEQSTGKVVRFEQLTTRLVKGQWEPWNPEETT